MTELANGQFEIDGVLFGGVWDNVKVRSVQFPESNWSVQDSDNQFRPGTFMGQDLLRPGEFVFSLVTDGYTMDEAKAAADRLASVWHKGGTRKPGSLSTLRYRYGNRTRVVYGRGRDFIHQFDQWSLSGASPIAASFKMVVPFYFDDGERAVDVGYTPPVTGGLVAPLMAPLTSAGTGASGVGGFISEVGGTAPTPVVIELHGPTRYATVSGDGWSVEYDKPIAFDQVVTIDCRFGYAVAYDNFGRICNGNLSWKTNLLNARLTPGPETITYRGYDLTGTSRARVRWSPAYHTY